MKRHCDADRNEGAVTTQIDLGSPVVVGTHAHGNRQFAISTHINGNGQCTVSTHVHGNLRRELRRMGRVEVKEVRFILLDG